MTGMENLYANAVAAHAFVRSHVITTASNNNNGGKNMKMLVAVVNEWLVGQWKTCISVLLRKAPRPDVPERRTLCYDNFFRTRNVRFDCLL